jgi:simple sugar transport system permease protein
VPYALNLQILVLVIAFAATWLLLNRTNIGRQIYALGGNKDAAQRLGFHVFRLNCLVYGYLGLIAGMASLVQAQLAQSVTPTVLVGKELDVLAAVVLGGASLTGGIGTVLGAILGVTLLAILQNGLVLLGVSSYWSQWFVGLTILCAVSITAWSERRRRAAKSIN